MVKKIFKRKLIFPDPVRTVRRIPGATIKALGQATDGIMNVTKMKELEKYLEKKGKRGGRRTRKRRRKKTRKRKRKKKSRRVKKRK